MSLSTPQQVQERLEAIERDIAERQGEYENAALEWYRRKRDREHDEALAFLAVEGTDTKRRMIAKRESAHIGKEEEARYEALRAVMRTLDTRAAIGMSLLKAQGRPEPMVASRNHRGGPDGMSGG